MSHDHPATPSLQALLQAAEPDDPQDAVVAQQVTCPPSLNVPVHSENVNISFECCRRGYQCYLNCL